MKKLFICLLTAVAVIGLVDPARAQVAPYQDEVTIATNAVTAVWDAPAATYGPLLTLQAVGLTNGATLAVSHVIRLENSSAVTNAVETAAAGATLLAYPSAYIPAVTHTYGITNGVTGTYTVAAAKPVWLCPGDKLLFTASATNGAEVSRIVIRAGFPGK